MVALYVHKLRSHRVLVLGGSSGIGFAVAEAALEHGADVIISSSNAGKIDNALQRLESHIQTAELSPSKVCGKPCDLASMDTLEENIKNLLEFATQDGKLDHVVFTAGDSFIPPSLESVTVEDISKASMVRVTGAIILAKHLPRYINQSTRSSFTVTSSTTDWRPAGTGWSVLKGAAGGVEPMARALAVDLKPIRVNCVTPGFVRTELFDGFPKEALDSMISSMERDSVLGNMGTASELAKAYIYLMKSTFATGSTVVVDGGRMIGDSKRTGSDM
ncbi:hypothetical protein B0T10DRAFT_400206 [Thelonectria olida]|uniref:Uncharacterized protein n=1 Tax=Thelonectria olida TaxID=1576542 RepID=A0A9P8W804_9HYPO|nr:hypothetical protein B0T10DRAFT_400206 [Thelonectria olida]